MEQSSRSRDLENDSPSDYDIQLVLLNSGMSVQVLSGTAAAFANMEPWPRENIPWRKSSTTIRPNRTMLIDALDGMRPIESRPTQTDQLHHRLDLSYFSHRHKNNYKMANPPNTCNLPNFATLEAFNHVHGREQPTEAVRLQVVGFFGLVARWLPVENVWRLAAGGRQSPQPARFGVRVAGTECPIDCVIICVGDVGVPSCALSSAKCCQNAFPCVYVPRVVPDSRPVHLVRALPLALEIGRLNVHYVYVFVFCSGAKRLCRVQFSILVDPASSHMLVSKIKPCMSQYKLLYGETANGSLKQL